MKIKEFTEPADGLLAAARAAGFDVSRAQLARWHRIGLLSKPEVAWLGRGKGSRTIYPTGTTFQLIALCRLHEHERSLSVVGWKLWLRGFSVADRYWRTI